MIFKSNTKASELITKVKGSLEVMQMPDDTALYDILNRFVQGLYSGVISDVRTAEIEYENGIGYALSAIEDEELIPVRPCDVIKVAVSGCEYEKVEGDYMPEMHCAGERLYKLSHNGELILYPAISAPGKVCVYYRAIPLPYEADEERGVALPSEFMGLAEAKLYADIYRLLGEDELCANWSEEYNAQMTRFGLWLEVH